MRPSVMPPACRQATALLTKCDSLRPVQYLCLDMRTLTNKTFEDSLHAWVCPNKILTSMTCALQLLTTPHDTMTSCLIATTLWEVSRQVLVAITHSLPVSDHVFNQPGKHQAPGSMLRKHISTVHPPVPNLYTLLPNHQTGRHRSLHSLTTHNVFTFFTLGIRMYVSCYACWIRNMHVIHSVK